jgi:CRISPR-associated protein Cas2
MQFVVCYDIADDGRRSRLASTLLDFGARAQESVFVANLDKELAARMMQRITKLIEEHQDRVHVFELCGACAERTRMLGTAELAKDQQFYII